MAFTKRFTYPIACQAFFALAMAAQAQSWNNVTAISPGTQVRITSARPNAVQGTLQRVTGEALALNSSAGQETFERQQIKRVSVTKQSRRARNALIGLGVGAGTGLGVGAASDHSCASKGCLFGNNFGKAILTPFLAGVGALVGGLIPSGGWLEVYRQ